MAAPGATADVNRRPNAGPEPLRVGNTTVFVLPLATFVEDAAHLLAVALRDLEDGDRSLALSGGTTPGPIYAALARSAGVPWERIRIFFADERAVPAEDRASNYRLVRETLLERLPVPAAAVLRMEAERADLEEAAARYERLLPRRLDVLVLGIGEDGHTASLFPGSPALAEGTRRVTTARSPSPPTARLTVTPFVLRSARRIFLFARGPAKAAAVREALLGEVDVSSCPARLAGGGTWVIDAEAAAGLGR